ncbi:putative disease resistance protein, partial [Mucuna pruriens]
MDPIVSTTTESALQIGGGVIKRQVSYFFNYNEKFEEVKQYIEMLDNARKRVQNAINDANAEEIEDDVKHWLKHVDEKIKKYKSFICDESHAKTTCSIGFFPNNLQLRYRLGRNATKMVEEIKADELWTKKFDKVSYRLRPSMDAALSNTGYESFASRTKTMEMIMHALEDSTVNMIGVYGVGGVGKTTLVKEVAREAKEKKLFNMVVMANIRRNPDIKEIQGEIAEMLGMRLEEESEIVRADRIRKRLKNEKENILIILYDLWNGLDLNRLGIPCSDNKDGSQQDGKDFGYNNIEKDKLSANFNKLKEKLSGDQKGCKILLTSTSKEVLCNQMDVPKGSTFFVGILDEKEAESLLKKVAGIDVKNSVFDVKAIEIAKMCSGLPIALVSIGRALKNKSSSVWEDVCQQINRQSFTEGQESIEFSVKLSYDHLKNDQLKHVFLHCARMGNDALIMDLVKFCTGLGLLQGIHTIREARDKVKVLIEELKESSLLVESYSTDRFNMHDIVRDVALSISSKEKHVLFMKNGILDEWPHEDELERYTAIFLHYCDLNDELPKSIYCPRLEVLHIDNKNDSFEIPDKFFKDMIRLRVLILTGVNLSRLPSSIKYLKKLRMLCLERCILGKNLSIIGELRKLRILTLSGSDVKSLPLEFGKLDKLQLFDLSNCSTLRVIPSNIISRLNILEEFYMRDSMILGKAKENDQSENASLSELRHLNQLRNIDIHIQNVAHFPNNLFFDMLDSYKIVIGEFNMLTMGEFKIPDKYEMVKFLALNLKEGIALHSQIWIKMLFRRVEYLLLGEINDVHQVFYELNVEGFPNLKHLSIANNLSIQYIIESTDLAFPKLESMCLYKLKNLEKICCRQPTKDSFCSLKIIKIKTCDQLENLFPFSMVRLLTKLETIEVCDSHSLKEIVSVESETHTISDDKIEFPQLRLLILQSLPAFTCLYTNHKVSSSALSLEDQVPNKNKDISTEVGQGPINACLSLFNEKVSVPKLERLELSSISILKIWSDQSLHCFQNLLTLNVTDCGNLKYLMSFSMAEILMNLQSLSVSACEMMEDIFRPEDAQQNIDVFPKLKTIEIICMEKLNTIWQPHIGLHSFHSLDTLIIRECHKLVTIFPSYMVQSSQSLQSLTITNCKLVENIFDFGNIPQTCDSGNETNLHDVSLEKLPNLVHVWKGDPREILRYNNLQSINVDGSPNLKYLFPLSIANDLEKLELLQILGCERMKEIVSWDKGSNENAIAFKFPRLYTVSLQQLSELVSFYPGSHTLECQSLKTLFIFNCWKLEGLTAETTNSQVKPVVLAEEVIYNLEMMAVNLLEAKWLKKYIGRIDRMHTLQTLILCELKSSKILFWFLHRLPNLKKLMLVMCHMKRIWAPGRIISHKKIGVVMQLKVLELIKLLNLKKIGFEHDPLLQRLEHLVINECTKLTNLASSSVCFSYLTHLEVENCRLMKNLMTCSTAKSLVQVTTIKVSSCPMIDEIFTENEEEKVQEIEFKQLKALELVSLQDLTSFSSSERCNFKFPLLENLVVSECPQMTKFSQVHSAPNLRKVHVVEGEKDTCYWEGDLNGTLIFLANQVPFEHSKQLTITKDFELENIWHSKAAFPDNHFCSLKTLVVKNITKDHVIPSHILACFKSLEELQVHNCKAVKVIFDIDHIDGQKTKRIMAFRLKKLTLNELSNLKWVWSKKTRENVSFLNLQEIAVEECGKLATLFPSSIARNLGKLKTLKIRRCYKLVEFVRMEHKNETPELFEFPCLSSLFLFDLPMLSCFYREKHHLECPCLEKLNVAYCPKLKLFTSEFHDSHKEADIEGQVSAPITITRLQQPLFSVEKVVTKLKKLTLNEENIILLSHAHLAQHLLYKLKTLKLCFENDDNEKETLPYDFFHKVPSLERLQVQRCFGLKEIFPSQKLQVHDGILAGLSKLTLMELEQLKLIGLEHPWVKPYSEKLEVLALVKCSQLKRIVRCQVSFINLKRLFVFSCKGMKSLFTFSTAKSLVKLESLFIQDCDLIKEIVKEEVEDDSDEIIFGNFTTLILNSLPSLVSFYSGSATLQFSCLGRAKVVKCPKMKTFSEGLVNAPLFHGIETSMEDSDLTFHHDPNTTIEMLFHKQ